MDNKTAQRRLKAHGFDPGPVDGIWGDRSEEALKAFQRAKGLYADGVNGPITQAALNCPPDTSPVAADPGGELIGAGFWKHFAPRALPGMREALNRAARTYGITTKLRLAHWLGQMHVESRGFTDVEEDLSYSAERLMAVWPSRFRTLASAQPYARNPRALANKTYGGRMGNDTADDGWRYRGRGPKQLTGEDNYRWAERITGHPIVSNPDLVATNLQVGADVAGAYFRDKGCARFADADDIEGLTRAINGGLIGLADRRTQTNRAKRLLGI